MKGHEVKGHFVLVGVIKKRRRVEFFRDHEFAWLRLARVGWLVVARCWRREDTAVRLHYLWSEQPGTKTYAFIVKLNV